MEFWSQFWPQLTSTLIGMCLGIPITIFATFLGALLGVWGALWLERRQEQRKSLAEKNEAEIRRQKILRNLQKSLVTSKKSIEGWQSELRLGNDREAKLSLIIPSGEIWRAYREGGELRWINDPELLSKLSGVFAFIGHIKFVNETLYASFISTNYEDATKSLWYKGQLDETFANMCESALEIIDDAIDIINDELSK